MTTPSISAVGLSKRYAMPSAPDGWLDALRDVSFEIQQGEAVGLIGRNGAGKSTLLRILSRVTRPTAGHADVYGTVGALLEVGTGFHPELTGRENTYLSGAILGLSKREVQARFDEIVAFSEIEAFIDTPVKRYSSGMYARLGFAVAAHLRPSILIVDEVLAVGDLAFQAKCLAHMHRLTGDGTSVLFVSHNLLAIADLCRRSLVMESGRLLFDGASNDAIATYRGALAAGRAGPASAESSAWLSIAGQHSDGTTTMGSGGRLTADLKVERPQGDPETPVALNLVIETPDGRPVVHLRNDLVGVALSVSPGSTTLRISIDELPLAPGSYWLWARAVSMEPNDPFIIDSDPTLLQVIGESATSAVVVPPHRFERVAVPEVAHVGAH